MNHLFNSRPSYFSIIEKQRLAYHRLHNDKTTRSDPEMAHYRRSLLPVPLVDVELYNARAGAKRAEVGEQVSQAKRGMNVFRVKRGEDNIGHRGQPSMPAGFGAMRQVATWCPN